MVHVVYYSCLPPQVALTVVTFCASTDMDNMFSNAASVAKNLLSDVLHDDVVFEKILARVELGLRRYAYPKAKPNERIRS
jgi:hypothetical protein